MILVPGHPALHVFHYGECAVFLLLLLALAMLPSSLGGRVITLPGSRSRVSGIARAPGRPAAPVSIHRVWNRGRPIATLLWKVWALKQDGLVSSHLFCDRLCGTLQLYSEDCKKLLMEGVWYIVWLLFYRWMFPVLIAWSQITTLSLNTDHKCPVNISVLPLYVLEHVLTPRSLPLLKKIWVNVLSRVWKPCLWPNLFLYEILLLHYNRQNNIILQEQYVVVWMIKALHSFWHLNIWFLVAICVLGRLRRCSLAGDNVLLGLDFEVPKAACCFQCSLSLSVCGSRYKVSALVLETRHPILPVLPNIPTLRSCTPQIHPFFY